MRSVNANLLEINQADKTGNAPPARRYLLRLADLRFYREIRSFPVMVISGHFHFKLEYLWLNP